MSDIFSKFVEITDNPISDIYDHGWFPLDNIKVVVALFDTGYAELIYQGNSHNVLELSVVDEVNSRYYKLSLNKEFSAKSLAQESSRDLVYDIDFVHLELLDDYWEKLEAIVNGRPYDIRVLISVDIDHTSYIALSRLALVAGQPVTEFVSDIISTVILANKETPIND